MRSTYSSLRRTDFADSPTVFLLIAGLFLVFTTIAVYAYAALS